jgi:DNA/RNA endonuclease YhcR with UshA esterase domain
MKPGTPFVIAIAVLAAGLACSKEPKQQAEQAQKPQSEAKPPMTEKEYTVMGQYVNDQDSLPRLRYFDG